MVNFFKRSAKEGVRSLVIRINVDNYEEAYKFFMSRGFRHAKGFAPGTTASSKYAYLVSQSGFIVDIAEHIKE